MAVLTRLSADQTPPRQLCQNHVFALEDNRIAMHGKLPYDSVFICDEFAVAIVNMVEEQGLAA